MIFERVLKGIVIAVEALEYNLRQEVSTNREKGTLSLPYYSNLS